MEFAYDGGGTGKGGLATLFVNGQKVGEGRVARTQPFAFSAEDGTDVGMDEGTPVVEDYEPRSTRFNGTIKMVKVDVKEMGPFDQAENRKAAVEGAIRKAQSD
jgi:arylsulfatase